MLGPESPEAVLEHGGIENVLPEDAIAVMKQALRGVDAREEIVNYVVDIVRKTRTHESVLSGAGPRATQALLLASRAAAALQQRDFVTPDDVRAIAPAVLGHRIVLRPEAEIEGVLMAEVLDAVVPGYPGTPLIRPARRAPHRPWLIVAPLWGWAGADPRHPERAVSAILLAFALAAVDARRGIEGFATGPFPRLSIYGFFKTADRVSHQRLYDSPEPHAAQVHIPFPLEFGVLDDVITVDLAGKSTVEVSAFRAARRV